MSHKPPGGSTARWGALRTSATHCALCVACDATMSAMPRNICAGSTCRGTSVACQLLTQQQTQVWRVVACPENLQPAPPTDAVHPKAHLRQLWRLSCRLTSGLRRSIHRYRTRCKCCAGSKSTPLHRHTRARLSAA